MSETKQNNHWMQCGDGFLPALLIYERHYSCRKYKDGRVRKLFVGPGEKEVLITPEYDALFVWRKFIDASGQQGINCSIFRNESSKLSSELILHAEAFAVNRWPGERLYTYVSTTKIRSVNHGCCFKKAGWSKCGVTKNGLLIFHKNAKKGGE